MESLFKWLKRHLKIKKFFFFGGGYYGECSEDTNLYRHICSPACFNRQTQYAQLDRSIYEILQVSSISISDNTHLKDLFDKTKFQYNKEPLGFNESVLFNA